MKTNRLLCTLVVFPLLTLWATSQAAPQVAEKGPKWEYAELTFYWSNTTPAGQAGAVRPDIVRFQWTTADQTIDADGWDEVAEKFKAPRVKEEGTRNQLKLRLLNRLSNDGWEMVDHVRPGTGIKESWTFKRRAP